MKLKSQKSSASYTVTHAKLRYLYAERALPSDIWEMIVA